MSDIFFVVRKGYDIASVDEYVKHTSDRIAKLEEEAKQSKADVDALKKIVDTYKEKESAINNAIVNAQISADSILLNAKNAAENIVINAKGQVEKVNEITENYLADIMRSLSPQRQMLQNFRTEYDAIVSKYLKNITEGDLASIDEKLNALEDHVRNLQSQSGE